MLRNLPQLKKPNEFWEIFLNYIFAPYFNNKNNNNSNNNNNNNSNNNNKRLLVAFTRAAGIISLQ